MNFFPVVPRRLALTLLMSAGVLLGAPAASALDEKAALQSLMTSVYGNYDARAKGWRIAHAGATYVVKPVKVDRIATPYGERLYVFVSGALPEGAQAGHVTTGVVGAHVLEERDGKAALVASTRAMPAGAFGNAPAEAKLLQFGPDHYYGWVYADGYTGQGYTQSLNFILLPRGRRVDVLAKVMASMDNQGAKPCDDRATRAECEELKFELGIDMSAPGVKVWPLVVKKSGIQAGRKIAPQTTRIVFDEKSWQYAVPKPLTEGY